MLHKLAYQSLLTLFKVIIVIPEEAKQKASWSIAS